MNRENDTQQEICCGPGIFLGGARACELAWGLGALVYGGHDGCSWLDGGGGGGLLGLITLASQCLPLLVLRV